MNKCFELPVEDNAEYYTVRIAGQEVFDQPVKNDTITYDNIRKSTIGQGYDLHFDKH